MIRTFVLTTNGILLHVFYNVRGKGGGGVRTGSINSLQYLRPPTLVFMTCQTLQYLIYSICMVYIDFCTL